MSRYPALPRLEGGLTIGSVPRLAVEVLSWAVATAWCVRTKTTALQLGNVADLSAPEWDRSPAQKPRLLVVVPAKDEGATVLAAMETLLAADYPALRIVAIDDRSEDDTGRILDDLATGNPGRLQVLHLAETAEGWIGKTFAMAVGTEQVMSEYVLYTDADVWFSPSILRRALAYAEFTRADHLVVAPTVVTKTWGERTVLGFLQVLALWICAPGKVADPRARWNVAAAGAFNLVRREALEELGGWAPQRLAVVEDITLGRRVRAAGMRQRVAFAPGLVLVHWAPGAWGLIRGMTKNFFAFVNFRATLLVSAMGGLVLLFLAPMAGLFWWPTVAPSVLTLGCLAVWYRLMKRVSETPARFGWLYPLGAAAILWAMLRSMAVTLWARGVTWRGTFYPLRALRQHNSPFQWEWEATLGRAERKRAERNARPSALLRMARRARRRPAPAPPRAPGRSDAGRSRPE